MYLLAPFILQNLAPFILIQSYESVPFWGSKWPNCYYFHLPIGPFHFFFFFLLGGGGGIVTKKDQKAVGKKLYLLETNSEERNT